MHVGDRSPDLDITLKKADGTVLDLSSGGTTAKLYLRNSKTRALVINGAGMTIQAPATGGRVTYAWQPADVTTEGEYEGIVVVNLGGAGIESSYPSDGTFPVVLLAR
jgi:hypothetical protein